jgi:sialic acid synthase SpsE/quercetin dioxygenase-like cupin family protein
MLLAERHIRCQSACRFARHRAVWAREARADGTHQISNDSAMNTDPSPLFIFEMANNHQGSVQHGIRIVRELADAARGFPFRFAVKLQYRDIDSFVHPDYRERYDLKFVKRFSSTRLSWDEYKQLKDAIREHGFLSMCTPWDELSVAKIEEHDFDILKIPSCYFTDWPLLERIAQWDKHIIASAGGAALEDIDRVVSFFEHRKKQLSLMHCVGEYPTPNDRLELNQIDLFRRRYPKVAIGYSTHESPANLEAIKLAIAKGARLFEKHVGVPTDTIELNAYSANPDQVRRWLESAAEAYRMCGVEDTRCSFSSEQVSTLRDLQRGAFARTRIKRGEKIGGSRLFLAIPNAPTQIVANDLSKYTEFVATEDIEVNAPITRENTRQVERRELVYKAIQQVREVLNASRVITPSQADLEISHHYGLENFARFGSTVITVVNREYCKRLIVLIPGQTHPEQWHNLKDETYHILHGEILLKLDGVERVYAANDVITIPRGVKHGFVTSTGVVIEEISTCYTQGDSLYTDPAIEKNLERKTYVTYWMD